MFNNRGLALQSSVRSTHIVGYDGQSVCPNMDDPVGGQVKKRSRPMWIKPLSPFLSPYLYFHGREILMVVHQTFNRDYF